MTSVDRIKVSSEKLLIERSGQVMTLAVHRWQSTQKPIGTIICLHEFTGNGRDFDNIASLLCAYGFTVICPDLLGRGRSAYLGANSPYDLDLFQRSILAVIDFAGREECGFICQSSAATMFLIAWAKFNFKIRKLILIDPPMTYLPELDLNRDRILKEARQSFSSRAKAQDFVFKRILGSAPIDRDIANTFAKHRIAKTGSNFRLAFDEHATSGFAELRGKNYDLYPIAVRLDADKLFLLGEDCKTVDRDKLEDHVRNMPNTWMARLERKAPASLLDAHIAFLILGFFSAN